MDTSIDKKFGGVGQSSDQAFALTMDVLTSRFGLEGELVVSKSKDSMVIPHGDTLLRNTGAVILKKPDGDAYSLAQISEILDMKGDSVGIFVRLLADEFYRAGLEHGVYYGSKLRMRTHVSKCDLDSLAEELGAKLRNIWPKTKVTSNYYTEPVI